MSGTKQTEGAEFKPGRKLGLLDLVKRPYRLHVHGIDWRWFALSIRSRGCNLLDAANGFERPIFVSGCQRSGTTLLRSLIALSPDIAGSHQGRDEELAGAYVLCGKRAPRVRGRYCFQTTYINECYREYETVRSGFQLVWVLRGPQSVVYSMVYNWARYALNELFSSCGVGQLGESELREFQRRGLGAFSPIERACYAYVGKCRQLIELTQSLDGERVTVVAYEEILEDPQGVMCQLADFLSIVPPRDSAYPLIDPTTIGKATQLTASERATVDRICGSVFEDCLALPVRFRR